MLACKKTNKQLTLYLLLLLSFWSFAASSRGFTIDHIEARLDGKSIQVDGKLTLNLTGDVRKALSKSIPLQLNMEFVLKRVRNYVWDKEVAIWIVPIAIFYKPVSDEYVISRPDLLDQQESFGSQNAALERLGAFRHLNLPLEQPVLPEKKYILETRIKLDLSKLPAMMRPLAYFSSSWHLNSKWTEWPLKH
ncbi:MAG: hypothetical protein IEMM0001_0667 [bacterium]|nr:MAG: hypothetical protein IEMM0001_0667 [bacterium]